jgi:hypothetical protein
MHDDEYWKEQWRLTKDNDLQFLKDCGMVIGVLFWLAMIVGFIKLVWILV